MIDSNRIAAAAVGHSGEIRTSCDCEGGQQKTITVNCDSGVWHCHRCGAKGNFKSNDHHKSKPQFIWEQAVPCEDHPYLKSKGVNAHGLRMDTHGNLVVPLSADGQLKTLQLISEDGNKIFLKGFPKKGASFQIGDGDGDTLYIGEGFATMASIYAATGGLVFMAVDAGNILPAAENLKRTYPDKDFIFCADNDRAKDENAKGYDEGYKKACQAAAAVDGLVCMPEEPGADFNDVYVNQGIDAVNEIISMASPPPDDAVPEEKEKKDTVSDKLVKLVNDDDLFHDADGRAYIDIDRDDHRETVPVRSKVFKDYLSFLFFQKYQKSPASQSIQDALSTICGKAQFLGPERQVFVRIGYDDDAIYIDLARADWLVVKVTATGWQVVKNPPIRFWRPAGLRSLPIPARGGNIDKLAELLNINSRKNFMLIVGWLLSAMRPSGPYPVLTFGGEQGTGKSTAAKILRRLIDPNAADLRTTARTEQDLVIAAKNGWVIALDNLSGVKPWLSDALCRIATGGGFGTRQLYTDDDEILIEVQRPIIINGIEDLCTRGDLADRAIVVELPVIPSNKRVTEKTLNEQFTSANFGIMGCLLDAVVSGLKHQDAVVLSELPRMADAAIWWTACERDNALPWPEGSILAAFNSSRESVIQSFVESDEVAAGIVAMLKTRGPFEGTAAELLEELTAARGDRWSKSWPTTPKVLSGRLRRASSFLREYGIEVETKRTKKGRMIYVDYACHSASPASPATTENVFAFKTGA